MPNQSKITPFAASKAHCLSQVWRDTSVEHLLNSNSNRSRRPSFSGANVARQEMPQRLCDNVFLYASDPLLNNGGQAQATLLRVQLARKASLTTFEQTLNCILSLRDPPSFHFVPSLPTRLLSFIRKAKSVNRPSRIRTKSTAS